MIPDPLKDWYSDPKKSQELATLLESPVLKEAMAVLQFVALPRADYSVKNSAEMITEAAFEQKRNTGFFQYPTALWELTSMPIQPPKTPEGFSDSYVRSWAMKKGLLEDFQTAENQQQS